MKEWIGLAVLLLVVASYATYALTQPIAALAPTTAFHYYRPAQTVNLAWPAYGEAAVGAVGYGVLDTHGPERPLPTASTIKVLTALAVLKERPLAPTEAGPTITLTTDDVVSYNKYLAENGSVLHVVLGERLTERQALEALLLPSANNIAETLSRWAFGSIDAYNVYANTYAKQLGMTSTTVTDPSGFLPTTVSTPYDLVLLGMAAMNDATVASIASEPTATLPVQGVVHNVNALLGHAGIVGIKTGNNDQDPGCYLFASKQAIGTEPVTIIGVIMNGPSLSTTMRDALPLIASTTKGFSDVTVVKAGAVVGSYASAWAVAVQAVAATNLSFIAWSGAAVSGSIALSKVSVPSATNTPVGTVSAADHYTQVKLRAPLQPPSSWWRLLHPPQTGVR